MVSCNRLMELGDLLTCLLGIVLNVFEAVDVIPLIKNGSYEDLQLTVGQALLKRSEVHTYRSPLSTT
jgi:hypothetical protein